MRSVKPRMITTFDLFVVVVVLGYLLGVFSQRCAARVRGCVLRPLRSCIVTRCQPSGRRVPR
jgi:hypothetical protein